MGNVHFGRWAFVAGMVLAVAAGFFTIPYVLTILAILGLVVGFMNIRARESERYLIAVIALLIMGTGILEALSALGSLYGLGESILTNLISFIGASGLVVAVKQVVTMGQGE
ncbi:MAG: hypothetical protein WC080_02350 [Patescibacteria group bacterium]|jgi:hypothetical protein